MLVFYVANYRAPSEGNLARYTGPKNKISRREGVNLTGTPSRTLERRLNVPPGGGGTARGRRRTSDYALALRAKQRTKREYGMTESQFLRFFEMVRRMPGPTGINLLQLLERRLDNVIYRLGFAATRPMARQLVGHRHVMVNSKPVNIPSYLVHPSDVVQLDATAQQIPEIAEELQRPHAAFAPWLSREGSTGRVMKLPSRENSAPDIREDLIVEFYAR